MRCRCLTYAVDALLGALFYIVLGLTFLGQIDHEDSSRDIGLCLDLVISI